MTKLIEEQSSEMLAFIHHSRENYLKKKDLENNRYPATAPAPQPLVVSKAELYKDPCQFADIDKTASDVAQEVQSSFTDLVRRLIRNCTSDIEKARAIFQWISMKDLNVMQFAKNLKDDTPMGILRGIKLGTVTYEVLYKQLCSYAGLYCEVIDGYFKGHTPSDGAYLPGTHFEGDSWKCTSNAVYVAGSWRFVNCNWGARSIDTKSLITSYQFDDHYFLTDPREFIYSFFPLQEEWQLLEQPISLKDFEKLPLVYSSFFKYGLRFKETNAVMHTVAAGTTAVRIEMPVNKNSSLNFVYGLEFYETNVNTYNGVALNRYVMQTVVDNEVTFHVLAPCPGSFLLEIYAKKDLKEETTKQNGICTIKIVCKELQTVPMPLPECASHEWGPAKATRLFGLVPISHQEAQVIAIIGCYIMIEFRMTRSLGAFHAILRNNDYEENQLCKFVKHAVNGDVVTFTIKFPKMGQYGLDIYTRESSSTTKITTNLLEHCCSYLIINKKK